MTKAPPKWAQDLLIDACILLGVEDPPELIWRHCKRWGSSGTGAKNQVVVNAGSNKTDAKLVLLHEVSHAATPPSVIEYKPRGIWYGPDGKRRTDLKLKRYEYHSDAFWDNAWKLFRWARLPMRYCLQREGNYKRNAIPAYHRSLKRG